ncbi:MAG: 50S ribosomal protein L25 [Chloroflexi bacterium]|nr:50S ribosomal protein L25 [Chloroflexota bacterium]
MSDTVTLEVQQRTITGKKVRRLRREGWVPGIIYGTKIDPINVQMPYRPLEIALMQAGGTQLIDMKVDGKRHKVITREVQRDVILKTILHVDFVAVDASSVIRVEVPVQIIGESPAVQTNQAMLVAGASIVTVSMAADQLIDQIEVDISNLDVGDSLQIRDLVVPEGAVVENEPDQLIVLVQQITAPAAEEETEGEGEISEPELVERRRAEEDGEDA